MPIGASKVGALGGLVPGGSVTFNTSDTWVVPPGVKLVSVTGVGGVGSPGNAGTGGAAGNPGNPGIGGGGGSPVVSTQTRSGGYGGLNPNSATNGPAGTAGSGGGAGAPGNTGCAGQPSTALGSTFCGGAGGCGGAAGNPGNAGTGGNGGNVGQGSNFFNPCAQRAQGGTCGGGQGGDAWFGRPTSTGGGGAGEINSGGQGFNNPPPCCQEYVQGGAGGSPGGGIGGRGHKRFDQSPATPKCNRALSNAYFEYTTPFQTPTAPAPQRGGSFQNNQFYRQAFFNCCANNGVTTGFFQNRNYPWGGQPCTFAPFNATNLPGPEYDNSVGRSIQRGRNATTQRAGAGGGGGTAWTNVQGGAPSRTGGGGGGRGNAGNAGQAGQPGCAGNPGLAGTPSTVNCVPVSPGSPYPIVVGAPGGQIVISWNPQ